MPQITEIKHRPGNTSQTWTCELVAFTPDCIRIRYVSDRDYVVEGTMLPSGTTTDAVYWTNRPYHVWRFTSPDGTRPGYRFDVCTDTHISRDLLEWTDLALDLWIPENGEPVWMDGDEFDDLVDAGDITPEQARLARKTRDHLTNEWSRVIEEAFYS
jgi:predicted RNA-binding protein associated with RNAse of E/G family